ncbi:ABC transporter permease [Salinarimonas ramus]|uniref:ABC transporter permease n=1 Tax=Salinarimonas ramus TaxID=690164 RepID=A0A917V9A3_9HYPH|nr:ABC transporter permease [Salinarimonas ramus]
MPSKTPARRTGYGSRLSFAAGLALTLAIAGFLILPAILSMLAGVTANYFRGLSSGLTLRWVGEVLALYSDTIVLTLGLALATLATTLVLGVPAAWFLVRNPGRASRAIEELLTLPIAVPGLAIALAMILVWGGVGDLRTSWVFILIGHVLFTLPFMMRAVVANLQAIDARTLEEGAASLGAGPWRRFLEVIVPNARPGILAGSLMVVTLSVGEFNLTWMLHTPLTKTLPVGLADAYASMRLEVASAYTLVFFVMIIPLLVAIQWLGGLGAPGGKARR